MTKEQKIVLKHLLETNTVKYNLAKAAEELSELSLILQQKALKKTENFDDQHIIDEIGDVEIRMYILKKMFPKQKIKDRILYKISKFKEYIDKGLYIGGI